MKKIMTLAVGTLMAIAAQAAAVNWNSGAVYTPTDITAKVTKGSTDYTVQILFFTDSAGENAVTGLTGTSANTAANGGKYSGTADGLAASTTYYTQLVISTNGYEAKSALGEITTAGTGDITLNFATGSGFNSAFSFDTSVAGTWQSTAAPEPTSGLLLLLGMAGLALKRKVA